MQVKFHFHCHLMNKSYFTLQTEPLVALKPCKVFLMGTHMYVPRTRLKGIQSQIVLLCTVLSIVDLLKGLMMERTSLPPLLLLSTSLAKVGLLFADFPSLHCPSCEDLLRTRQEDDWSHGCLDVPPETKLFSVIVIDSFHKLN